MANLVKQKRRSTFLLLALLLLTFILKRSQNLDTSGLQSEFIWNSDSTLDFSDFRQPMPDLIFNSFDAAIHSRIDLAPDSLDSLLVCTIVDRSDSWFDTSNYSYELLSHEEYHVRLTDYHTRSMRAYLKEHNILTKDEIENELEIFMQLVHADQNRYDAQTQHSLIWSQQNYWEYKIDSMHSTLDRERGIFTDWFSGISARFPHVPDYVVESDSENLNVQFRLDKYDLIFRIHTRNDYYIDSANYQNDLIENFKSNGFDYSHVTKVMWKGYESWESIAVDSTNSMAFYDHIIYREPFYHQITFALPLELDTIKEYIRMRNSFFESVTLEQKYEYWINQVSNLNDTLLLVLNDWTVYEGNGSSQICDLTTSDRSFLFHYPILIQEQKKYLIPIEFVDHRWSEIEDIMVLVYDVDENDSRTYGASPIKSDSQYLLVPANFIKDSSFIILGYTLKADTNDKCAALFNTQFTMPITPKY